MPGAEKGQDAREQRRPLDALLRVERRTGGHEEDPEEDAFKRLDVGLNLSTVARAGEQHARGEGLVVDESPSCSAAGSIPTATSSAAATNAPPNGSAQPAQTRRRGCPQQDAAEAKGGLGDEQPELTLDQAPNPPQSAGSPAAAPPRVCSRG